jgi:hypothetical protein
MKLHLTLTTSIALSIVGASAQAQPRDTGGGPGGARGDGSYGMNINNIGHKSWSWGVLPRGPQRAVYGGGR